MISRAAAWVLALCVMGIAACGHYGPPLRPSEQARDKATAAPATPGATEPVQDEEKKPRD